MQSDEQSTESPVNEEIIGETTAKFDLLAINCSVFHRAGLPPFLYAGLLVRRLAQADCSVFHRAGLPLSLVRRPAHADWSLDAPMTIIPMKRSASAVKSRRCPQVG